MKIIMTKRKPGIYTQWFAIEAISNKGEHFTLLINHDDAKTYPQAIKYWNKWYAKNNTAITLRNTEPLDITYLFAA